MMFNALQITDIQSKLFLQIFSPNLTSPPQSCIVLSVCQGFHWPAGDQRVMQMKGLDVRSIRFLRVTKWITWYNACDGQMESL